MTGRRRPIRIVHTSDVHLGAYAGDGNASWVARRELMRQTFGRVIDLANESRADLLLIAGDFFDNDRVPDDTVEFAGEELARFGGQTVLLPGNHDPMDEGHIYWRYDLEAMAPGLHIIREPAGELVEPEGLDTVLWGRGYLDSDWHFRPLEGLPEVSDERWHIALGHGHFVPAGAAVERSLPILEGEIAAASDWDYLALGHWERQADVSAGGLTAVYSGAPMPLTDSNRQAGWAIVVDCDESGVRWTRRRVDPRPWDGAGK